MLTILSLIHDLAEHMDCVDKCFATRESLLSTLCFAPDPYSAPEGTGYAKTLLLRLPGTPIPSPASSLESQGAPDVGMSGEIVGMAIYFNNYSTWHSAPGIHLEDLFVQQAHRGKGYGMMLIKALAQETIRIGGKRLELSCKTDNHESLKFYRSRGGKELEEWVEFRFDGDVLQRLDEEASKEIVMKGF